MVLYTFKGRGVSPSSLSNFMFMYAWSISGAIFCLSYCGLLIGGLIYPEREWVPDTWDELIDSDFSLAVPYQSKMHRMLEVGIILKNVINGC